MDDRQKADVIFMSNGISYLPVQRVIIAVLVRRLSPNWNLHYKSLTGKVNSLIVCLNQVLRSLHVTRVASTHL